MWPPYYQFVQPLVVATLDVRPSWWINREHKRALRYDHKAKRKQYEAIKSGR